MHREDPVEVLERDRLDPAAAHAAAGVVDQHVEAPAGACRGRDRAGGVGLQRRVGLDEGRAGGLRDLGAERGATTAEEDGGPFGDEPLDDATTDAAGSAGDDGDLSLELDERLLLAVERRVSMPGRFAASLVFASARTAPTSP